MTPSSQLLLGQVIGSRYRVQSLIGRGGMGMVYAAMHELTGRRVALKLMVTDNDDSPMLHDRFLSEARIAAAVRHPNIVDVLDMGLHGGAPFIVMELLEGRSLEQMVQSQTRLSVEQCLAWAFPILGALAVLHDAGIVHRDVKPSNIFMSALPRHPMRPKLLDFGLARVVSDLRLTRSGTVIGTPLYMAPEHAAGAVTGPQADVWSIGVVLYEALSGSSPFQYTDRSSLAIQVLAGQVRPLSEVAEHLPEPVRHVIHRALQRDLGRRFPDMRSLAESLLAAARVANIPVPNDPDPIGLPDYQSWLHGRQLQATTHPHTTPSGPVRVSTSAPSAFGQTVALPTASRSEGGSDASLRAAPKPQRRWLYALPALLLLLVGAWWMRQSKRGAAISARHPRELAPAATTRPTVEGSVTPRFEQRPTVESLSLPRSAEPADGSNRARSTTRTAIPSVQSGVTRANTAASIKRKLPAKEERPSESPGPNDRSRSPKTAPTQDEVESEWK